MLHLKKFSCNYSANRNSETKVPFFKNFRVIPFNSYWCHFKQIKNWQQNIRHEVSPKCSFKFIASSWSRCTSLSSFHVEFCEAHTGDEYLFTAVVTGTPGSPQPTHSATSHIKRQMWMSAWHSDHTYGHWNSRKPEPCKRRHVIVHSKWKY